MNRIERGGFHSCIHRMAELFPNFAAADIHS